MKRAIRASVSTVPVSFTDWLGEAKHRQSWQRSLSAGVQHGLSLVREPSENQHDLRRDGVDGDNSCQQEVDELGDSGRLQ